MLKILFCKKSIYCLQSKKPFRFSWFRQQLEKSWKLFLKILIFIFCIKKTPFWFKLGYCTTTLTGALAVFTLFNASSSKSFYNSPLISGFIRLTPRTDNEWQKVPQSSLLLKGLPLKDMMFFYAKIFAARNSLGWPKSREKT